MNINNIIVFIISIALVVITGCEPPGPKNWYIDLDSDGFGNTLIRISAIEKPNGYVLDNTDCNDDDPDNFPGNTERWDGKDNDCDELTDEGTQAPPFPGGLIDADIDGIPDMYEQPGAVLQGMPLYEWGARPNQRDVFIQIDYMDSTNGGSLPLDEGALPNEAALQKVAAAFAAEGTVVHFDVGDLFDQSADDSINPDRFDLGGGSEVPYLPTMGYSGQDGDVRDYRDNYLAPARRNIFYYMLFATAHNPSVYGIAQLSAYTSIVFMANRKLNTSTPAKTNELVNLQAVTVMHEFGHNLGLGHGGASSTGYNNKPNYVSSMNYLYAVYGIPAIGPGNDEGDRYYLFRNYDGDYPLCAQNYPYNTSSVSHSRYSDTLIIDFSHGTNSDLDESFLIDADGLGTANGVAVDWDCDPSTTTLVNGDVNLDDGMISTYSDYDDWANLHFGFGENYALRSALFDTLIIEPEPTIIYDDWTILLNE